MSTQTEDQYRIATGFASPAEWREFAIERGYITQVWLNWYDKSEGRAEILEDFIAEIESLDAFVSEQDVMELDSARGALADISVHRSAVEGYLAQASKAKKADLRLDNLSER